MMLLLALPAMDDRNAAIMEENNSLGLRKRQATLKIIYLSFKKDTIGRKDSDNNHIPI